MAGSVYELELERLRVLPIRTLRYCSDALARYPRARLLITSRNEVIADLCREHSVNWGLNVVSDRGGSTGRLPWSTSRLPDSMQRRS
jgi:hypothetical protein